MAYNSAMAQRAIVRHSDQVMRTVAGMEWRNATGTEARIVRSWARCARAYHLAPDRRYVPHVIEAGSLRERVQRHAELIQVASAEMDLLYEHIAGSGYALLLTDAHGIILRQRVDPTLRQMFRTAGLLPGADWSERSEGTNGIGTCLAELRPVTVHRDEHFSSHHIGLSCSGALIRDPRDEVIAVLDASCVGTRDPRASQAQTLSLVNVAAYGIEKCLFVQRHRHHALLRFHWRPECVNLSYDGALALDADGTVIAADRSAVALLARKDRSELIGCRLDELFELRRDQLVRAVRLTGTVRAASPALRAVRDRSRGHRFFVSLQQDRAAVRTSPGRHSASPSYAIPAEREAERALLLTAIERCRWNMSHAARQLGMSRNTLYRRIKLFGLPLPHARHLPES